jgi:signal transduction histidine kinase
MFTILWLIDHYKMIKIQNIYAADNRQMSQKLHRSKEILPALASYVSNMEQEPDEQLRRKLEAVCHDYGKELGGREMSADLFESTGVAMVDLLLSTKVVECDKMDIELDVFVNARMDKALKHVDIGGGEMARMLGDLIRNAVHAVEPVREKMILLVIAMDEEQHLLIQIYDSGIPFSPEVLEHFGERGQTTWGTGNGLADTIETLGRAGASLELCQDMQKQDVFTKCIAIRFDGRGTVEIKK